MAVQKGRTWSSAASPSPARHTEYACHVFYQYKSRSSGLYSDESILYAAKDTGNVTGVCTLDAIIPVLSCRICLTLTYWYAVGRHWPGLADICLGGCSRFELARRPVRHFLVTVEYRQGLRGCSCCKHISTACLFLEIPSRRFLSLQSRLFRFVSWCSSKPAQTTVSSQHGMDKLRRSCWMTKWIVE